jgi:hypothetical protein
MIAKDILEQRGITKNIKIWYGDFYLDNYELYSLKGCPEKVVGDFDCSYNRLISLEGCPKEVTGNFYCYYSSDTKYFTREDIERLCKVGGRIVVKLGE